MFWDPVSGQKPPVDCGGQECARVSLPADVHSPPAAWPWAGHVTALEPPGRGTAFTGPRGLLCSRHSPGSDGSPGSHAVRLKRGCTPVSAKDAEREPSAGERWLCFRWAVSSEKLRKGREA